MWIRNSAAAARVVLVDAVHARPKIYRGTSFGAAPMHRHFASYEGQTISDEQLLKGSDDWAIEETNFCLGRFPAVRRYPETSDMSRRVLMMMEINMKRMFTRLRDGTVIPVSTQTVYDMYDNPESVFNYFERPIVKFTWDETYDDAWEAEEPEFEAGEIPTPPEREEEMQDDESMERFMVRKSTAGQ